MIIDKKEQWRRKPVLTIPQPKITPIVRKGDTPPSREEVFAIDANPLIEIYRAVKRILGTIKLDPKDPSSPPFFQTIKMDNGQFNRIVRHKINEEYAVAFPAAFIRFTDVHYLVQHQRTSEGRANMRIRYILNNLNVNDEEVELEGLVRYQQIDDAIQKGKDTEPVLTERCRRQYFDMPQTTDDGLQAYWIDYEMWFRSTSAFQYKDYVERYIVMPPFTNHSDAPDHDTEGHGDHQVDYDDATKFEPSVETYIPAPLPGVLK